METSQSGRSVVHGPQPAPTPASDLAVDRLQTLLAQIGAEIAGPLTSAMERINTLASTGRIDGASVRALRDEVEAARQAGMIGQQLTRFATGRMRQSHEVLQLADVVRHVLTNRQRQIEARGVTFQPELAPVEVVVDASLLFSLLNATVDWALANAASPVEFAISAQSGATAAKLVCRFAQRPADEPTSNVPTPYDSLTWQLIDTTAKAIGLAVDRTQEAESSRVVFGFPLAVEPGARGDRTPDSDEGFAVSVNSQPLAGSHVLVIASRREMRMGIRDALRSMSLIVDFVNSVDEAAAFCREGLPHAIIIEAIQSGERFARFRAGIVKEVPGFVFIEIVEEGRALERSGAASGDMARVGRDALAASLPSALMYELSKGL